jgi:hypothetical protein
MIIRIRFNFNNLNPPTPFTKGGKQESFTISPFEKGGKQELFTISPFEKGGLRGIFFALANDIFYLYLSKFTLSFFALLYWVITNSR